MARRHDCARARPAGGTHAGRCAGDWFRASQAWRTARALILMATMLQSSVLSALAGIRHGFFTRTGGVSTGCYESLNGGVGSDDVPAHVAENRARMATAIGVLPGRLISAYQIHSPVVVTVDAPWDGNARPKADAIVTRASGPAIAV